jgi:Putative auto-transporter adhesin, head GIN domain
LLNIFLLQTFTKTLTMKKLLIFAAIAFSVASCSHIEGSGNIVTEKRQVGDFKGISAGGGFEVELKTGPVISVEVEADDNLIKLIETRVSGDVLRIETRDNFNIHDGHYKVYVTAPEITSIKSSGAANIKAVDILKSDSKITLDASGAGNIKAAVDAPEIETEASGAGNIEISGKTREYDAKASGSGNIKSSKLMSETTDAEASGAGSVHVYASVNLKAHASGAGSIYYKGGASVDKSVSGAGSVKAED